MKSPDGSTNKISQSILDLISPDEEEFGFLFPNRIKLPEIKKHIFSDVKSIETSLDQFIISKMMDTDYIGWAAKVLLGIDLFPIQIATIQLLWKTTFPMLIGSRGGSKTFMLAVYVILRAILDQGCKIVIVGAGLRQARLVFNYIDTIWHNSPMLQNIVGGGKQAGPKQGVDSCRFKVGQSMIQAIPLGDGSKIRGLRANVIIADEFASIPEQIFDVVVRGFAAVTKTPVASAKRIAMIKKLKKLNIPQDIISKLYKDKTDNNQIVYSGTASYEFNHFYKRYKMWKEIIDTGDNMDAIAEIFGGYNMVPKGFDAKDYAVIRIPHTALPDGLLDQKQLAHAKAFLPNNIYLMEYGGVFVKDSDGFFPRTLVEGCTVGPGRPIATPDGEVVFTPSMIGTGGKKYVMGIDPAAEVNNLTVTILEMWPNHARVVYCWSIIKKEFKKRKDAGHIKGMDYYEYCCFKIRSLVKDFAVERIEMDSQGGGYNIAEMLRNKKLLNKEQKDFPIYEIIELDKEKDTDGQKDGRHILHLVQQSTEFNSEANLYLHKSLETKRLLFPAFDTVKMQGALIVEKHNDLLFDTYEENVNNIEELKNELCTIKRQETPTGKEKFDTPSVIDPSLVDEKGKKGKLQKDRYIGLLLSHKYFYENFLKADIPTIDYDDVAGNIEKVKTQGKEKDFYKGIGISRMRHGGDYYDSLGGAKNGNKL